MWNIAKVLKNKLLIWCPRRRRIRHALQEFGRHEEKRFETALRWFRKLERTNQPANQSTDNYCDWKEPKLIGRTQKTSFLLSSNSKASLFSIIELGTNPNSCASKSRRLSTAICGASFRKSSRLGTSRMYDLLETQLESLLTACIKI